MRPGAASTRIRLARLAWWVGTAVAVVVTYVVVRWSVVTIVGAGVRREWLARPELESWANPDSVGAPLATAIALGAVGLELVIATVVVLARRRTR